MPDRLPRITLRVFRVRDAQFAVVLLQLGKTPVHVAKRPTSSPMAISWIAGKRRIETRVQNLVPPGR
jgi:hypothetical protein